jgi:hypothetical protein
LHETNCDIRKDDCFWLHANTDTSESAQCVDKVWDKKREKRKIEKGKLRGLETYMFCVIDFISVSFYIFIERQL